LILNRGRNRAPSLSAAERIIAGLCSDTESQRRVARAEEQTRQQVNSVMGILRGLDYEESVSEYEAHGMRPDEAEALARRQSNEGYPTYEQSLDLSGPAPPARAGLPINWPMFRYSSGVAMRSSWEATARSRWSKRRSIRLVFFIAQVGVHSGRFH
jgi:hypothetical protein